MLSFSSLCSYLHRIKLLVCQLRQRWQTYLFAACLQCGKCAKSLHLTAENTDTNISFTIETECNGKIAFLDTLVSRRNGAIVLDVYRKPTHTDRYLDFNSHHDNRHKASTASTLLHRALSLPNSAEGKKRELNYVQAALESNGYLSKFIKNIHVKRS